MAETRKPAAEAEVPALRHPLQRPIPVFDEEVAELVFREPTGKDILEVGNPVVLDMASEPPRVTHDERKMTAMIARLANVPPSSVGRLTPQDWVACAWLLTNFFVPAPGSV